MVNNNDEAFMQLALQQAEYALDINEVPVGAVIVKNGEVISTGYNQRETNKNALHHAEMIAINKACEKLGGWRLFECEMYVNLEPCPMCAGAIIQSRIKRVVIGASDTKTGCAGSVVDLFSLSFPHKVQVEKGVLQQQAIQLLDRFFVNLRKISKDRPKWKKTE